MKHLPAEYFFIYKKLTADCAINDPADHFIDPCSARAENSLTVLARLTVRKN
jgi:hypothetical protein